jgi:hypothetical protein
VPAEVEVPAVQDPGAQGPEVAAAARDLAAGDQEPAAADQAREAAVAGPVQVDPGPAALALAVPAGAGPVAGVPAETASQRTARMSIGEC